MTCDHWLKTCAAWRPIHRGSQPCGCACPPGRPLNGRPDEVVSALGFSPESARIERTRLIFQ